MRLWHSPQAKCETVGLSSCTHPLDFARGPHGPHLEDQPFYQCPHALACTGGNASANQCLDGHDTEVPLCATCKTGYFLSGMKPSQREVCPGRASSETVTWELVVFVSFGFALYFCAVSWFVTRPAISRKQTRDSQTPATPSMQFGSSPLMAGSNSGDLRCRAPDLGQARDTEGSFQQILQDSPLTPSESNLLSAKSIKTGAAALLETISTALSRAARARRARARVKRKSKEAKRKSKEAQSERGGSSSSFRHEDQDTAGATTTRKKSKNADKKSVARRGRDLYDSSQPVRLCEHVRTAAQQQ